MSVARGGAQSVWVKQLPVGPFSRITFGDSAQFRPAWSADGRSLLYLTDRGTGGGLPYRTRADGTGPPETLIKTPFNFVGVTTSHDGRWVLVRRAATEAGNGDIYGFKLGDSVLTPLLTTQAKEVSPAISPDGRWLAYESDESSTSEVYVRPFPDVGSGRWQVSLNGGTAPRWAHSGRELFYVNGKQELVTRRGAAGSHVLGRRAEGALLARLLLADDQLPALRRVARRQAVHLRSGGHAGGWNRGRPHGELAPGAEGAGAEVSARGGAEPRREPHLQLPLTIDSLLTFTGPAAMPVSIVSLVGALPGVAFAGAPVTVTVWPTWSLSCTVLLVSQ